jgi:Fur family peroxide stress response transcriptional regulator
MITNKLSSLGLRQTFQRRRILEFLERTKSHPTADTIYKEIVKEIPTVSRTTVYNTVNKLAEEGIIKCIKTKDLEMRFDARTEPHYHFVCSECGKVYDVGICCKNVLKYDIDGHKVDDIFICYSGVCKTCREAVCKSGNKKG